MRRSDRRSEDQPVTVTVADVSVKQDVHLHGTWWTVSAIDDRVHARYRQRTIHLHLAVDGHTRTERLAADTEILARPARVVDHPGR